MKSTHAGFSLVELLVVSIILTLLSVFSISTFQTNRQEQAIQDELGLVSQTIKNLDDQVGIQLVDYQITFLSGGYYLTQINTLAHNNSPTLELSGSNLFIRAGSGWVLTRNRGSLWFLDDQGENNKSITMDISDTATYSFKGIKDGIDLTEYILQPFSRIDTSNEISLQSIEDGSGTLYSTGKIQNSYQGTKQYIFSGTTLTPPLIFHFLVNGDALEYVLEK